jgi:aminoglycoside phosphotransferase (APT) family kinase protein
MPTRDVNVLAERLRRSVPAARDLTGVRPLSTGHSNETYLLEGADLVLRLPPSQTPLVESAHSVAAQAEILQRLAATSSAPFLPTVRHTESDPDVLGDSFFLMDFAPGETFSEYGVPDWLGDGDDEFRNSVITQYVDSIISVHRHGQLDVLGRPLSTADELDKWRAVARAAKNERLLACFDALDRVHPAQSGAPTLVHGDPKPQNALFHQGRLTALLDWEMSFNGEPLWDLGYVLIFFESPVHAAFGGCDLPGMPNRSEVIDAWERGTGRSAAGVEWYEAASMAKVASLLAYGAYLGDNGLTTDERLKAWGPFAELFITNSEAETQSAIALFTSSN